MSELQQFVKDQLKTEVPELNVGDTVRVSVRIKEGDRERTQVFEGAIISRRGGGISESFTVRRISYGVGVERVFPIHSPNVQKVEIVRRGRVRRARLYYLRGRVGKAAKIKDQLR
ncbi:MAG TPA: 50S ribosomal protein L19 [Ruminococcaceae bacterium]|nr:50S ribosomal protein L19 [Oscillospiraceae bacterium]